MVVNNLTIVVDRSTDFRRSECKDLRLGRDVVGVGLTQSNATIKATEIRIR